MTNFKITGIQFEKSPLINADNFNVLNIVNVNLDKINNIFNLYKKELEQVLN